MIKNQWYAVLDAKELKENRAIGVTRFSEKLVFWRDSNDHIGCIYDQCCHRGASLSDGKVVSNHVECPFHGFQYNSSGKVTMIPANGNRRTVPNQFKVNSYLAKEAYGFVWVWYGNQNENIPEIPFFEELNQGFSYGGFHENWGVHYTRAIENQLDVVHLPFVHKSTIGKGNKTLVNGPVVKWNGDLMTFYVKNEEDNGQAPQKPNDIDNYEKLFSLQLQMPNLWQNRISDKVRIVAAFAPIDEQNTRIYLRFYQSFMKIPVLKQMVNNLSSILNKTILHQDRRVVINQLPKKSELIMRENLIQGDLPIIEFRKKRDELKNINKK
jgi:phenylpropionate dioxygenase-like ring-hydroxylating dioxygenase large terminal subunit